MQTACGQMFNEINWEAVRKSSSRNINRVISWGRKSWMGSCGLDKIWLYSHSWSSFHLLSGGAIDTAQDWEPWKRGCHKCATDHCSYIFGRSSLGHGRCSATREHNIQPSNRHYVVLAPHVDPPRWCTIMALVLAFSAVFLKWLL